MDPINFLGLNFTPITLQQKSRISSILQKYPHCLNGYTFASLLSWEKVYRYAYSFLDEDTLLVATWIHDLKQFHLLEPIGIFSEIAQKRLLQILSLSPYPIKITRVEDRFLEKNENFCSHFDVFNDRNRANYLYKTSDLANLAGGNYEKKRNLISQGKKLYDWLVEPLSEKCHPHCPKILEEIGKKEELKTSFTLQNELKALNTMLNNYNKLDVNGLCILINDVPVAFSIYGELKDNTMDIYFEKADRNFKGLYQIINQEAAKKILQMNYPYINREEDLGVEGLRQAKTSYFPCKLINYNTLTSKHLKGISFLG
jgi:hypothetical protein